MGKGKKRRETGRIHPDLLLHQFSFCARDQSFPPSMSPKSTPSLQRLSAWSSSCVQLSRGSFEDIPAAAAPKKLFQVSFMCALVKRPLKQLKWKCCSNVPIRIYIFLHKLEFRRDTANFMMFC